MLRAAPSASVFCATLLRRDIRQRADRQRTKLHAVRRGAGLDGVGVINAGAARREQAQVTIHGVLIQRNQQIDSVAHALHLVDAGANGEKCVAAADDRLVGVVGVQMQPAPAEDQCEDVARRSHTLSGRAANTEGECLTHKVLSQLKPPDVISDGAGSACEVTWPAWLQQASRLEQTSGEYRVTPGHLYGEKNSPVRTAPLLGGNQHTRIATESARGTAGASSTAPAIVDGGTIAPARPYGARSSAECGRCGAACRQRRSRPQPQPAPSCRRFLRPLRCGPCPPRTRF